MMPTLDGYEVWPSHQEDRNAPRKSLFSFLNGPLRDAGQNSAVSKSAGTIT
jgi:hypothetical protein